MKTLISAGLFVLLCSASSLSASSISFQFTIDTFTLSGQADNLDFQLDPGDVSSPYIALDISDFVLTGGSFTANQIVLTGDASGSLASDLTLDNNTGYNDAYQAVQLGTSVTFLATFSGVGVDSPASPGSSFGFSIYDNSGMTPLLTISPDGTIAGVNLDAGGVVPFANAATLGGSSDATVAPVPEPASAAGMLLGVALCAIAVQINRWRSAGKGTRQVAILPNHRVRFRAITS